MADEQIPPVRETILAMFWWEHEAVSFDPLDYETWPQRLRDLAGAVEEGLDNGDLTPLAEYLQAGFPLPVWLSQKLAQAINPTGTGLFRLKPVGRKPGEKGAKVAAERYSNNAMVGAYVGYLIHKGENYESAIAAAREKFGLALSSSAPAQHYKAWRGKAYKEDGSVSVFYKHMLTERWWRLYFSNRSD